MKTISTLIIIICASFIVSAQSFKDYYFSSIGFSPYLDLGVTPAQVFCPAYSKDGLDTACVIHQSFYAGAISIAYEGRYNLYQSGDNLAVSVKAKPVFSLSFSDYGACGFYFPIGVGLETGNGSTYQSSSNTGFTFTAGYSLNFNPLFSASSEKEDIYNIDAKSSWGCPFISAGIRYWSKKNKLREINILYGFGGSGDDVPAGGAQYGFVSEGDNTDGTVDGSWMIRVTWMKYINY